MFTAKIKEATLEYHQQVEKVLVGKLKNMRSKADYIDLLQLFYSYFGGLEQKIKLHVDQENLAGYNERRKTQAIADDLRVTGGIIPPFAVDSELPQINNELEAFGALYVIEGSTLGGKIISRMVQQHLNINDDTGVSFFNGYGEQTLPMWEQFKQTLDQKPKNEEEEQSILNSANETFILFKRWIEKSAIASF